MDAVVLTQTITEIESINAAHPLKPVDLSKPLTADLGTPIQPGTLMKRATDNYTSSGTLFFTVTGGAAGALTATGVLATDRLVRVYNETGDADLTAEFTISADDEIDNTGGTATTGDTLTVTVERDRVQSGDFEPWIQGTDEVELIAGVFAHNRAIDTDTDEAGLVRVFGPVNTNKLVAWTNAGGTTTATPSAAATAQLEAMNIFPM